jgi:hypothetical protein
MDNQGLLFIPDISGFTQFVNQTDIAHSRLIIQELLEVLINANEIGLEVSEIEGDAILFYKYGEAPGMEQLYKQVEKMFCTFHKHLMAYEFRRYCQCDACKSAIQLTLKVITHYGEFTGYTIKNFSKLIGKDVIVAHQLLKNDIAQHEYWLVTDNLVQDKSPEGLAQWMIWENSAKQTESGQVPFRYTQLSNLKNEIQPDPFPDLGIDKKRKMISASAEYDADIITLFHATGDFNYRSKWQEGVKAIENVDHFLPRIGMKHRCVLENRSVMIYSSSYYFRPDHIEFSETDEKKTTSSNFILERITDNKTRFTLDFYLRQNPFFQLFFNATLKKKMERLFRKSLENLHGVVAEIRQHAVAVE